MKTLLILLAILLFQSCTVFCPEKSKSSMQNEYLLNLTPREKNSVQKFGRIIKFHIGPSYGGGYIRQGQLIVEKFQNGFNFIPILEWKMISHNQVVITEIYDSLGILKSTKTFGKFGQLKTNTIHNKLKKRFRLDSVYYYNNKGGLEKLKIYLMRFDKKECGNYRYIKANTWLTFNSNGKVIDSTFHKNQVRILGIKAGSIPENSELIGQKSIN